MKLEFWTELEEGKAQLVKGGYFIRSNLKEFLDRLIEQGDEPVGIVYDGSYNFEIFTKASTTEEEDQ